MFPFPLFFCKTTKPTNLPTNQPNNTTKVFLKHHIRRPFFLCQKIKNVPIFQREKAPIANPFPSTWAAIG